LFEILDMKKSFLFILAMFLTAVSYSQTDSLLNSLQSANSSQQELLPKKMLFTQRWAWGEHGFLRGSKPITAEVRMDDMKIRRKMLIAHQIFGVATLAGFIGQAIVGPKLYNAQKTDADYHSLKQTHDLLTFSVNTTYSLTALMALFAPPPMVSRDKGLSAIRLHKWLAVVHLTGLIATNILGGLMEDGQNPQLKPYHRAAAYTTFASFAAAMIVIKLK